MKLKAPAAKFAVGNESKLSRHHTMDTDTDGDGEEQGEGLHRRTRHKGVASSDHSHTDVDSSEVVVMATPQAQPVQSTNLQSPEFENVIDQVGVVWGQVGVVWVRQVLATRIQGAFENNKLSGVLNR